jgi:multiple sugar transport system permease protein
VARPTEGGSGSMPAAESGPVTDLGVPDAAESGAVAGAGELAPKGPWLTVKRRETIAAYVFLAPWLIGLVGITAGPMLASLYLSFTDYRIIGSPRWVGLGNYVQMFTGDPRFWAAVRVTFTYVFVSVPLVLVFALSLAMVLNRGVRLLPFYRSVYYLPSLMGTSVAVAVLWRRVFGAEGLLNSILEAVFGIQMGSWLGNPDLAIWPLISLNVWTFGAAMVIFLAGLRQIPQDLYEAAAVDGASAVRRFVHITLPLLTPIIFFNTLLNIIAAFQAFTQAYVVSGGDGGPVNSTLFYTLYLYQRGFRQFDMGYASAMAWMLLLVIAAATALFFWTSRYWVFYGDER